MDTSFERQRTRRAFAHVASALLNLLLTLAALGLAFITWQEAIAHGRRMDDWHREAALERRVIREASAKMVQNGELMLDALTRSPEELRKVVEVIAKQQTQTGMRLARSSKRPISQRPIVTEQPVDYRPLPIFDR